MPIALYPELAKALTQVASRLRLWERLAPLEEQLLRRARGAFLVRWFGPLVPEHRLNLYIAIDNIVDLRDRLDLVRASTRGPETEMNLFRPLAAYAGTLLGSVFSVTGGFLVGFMAFELLTGLGTAWYEDIPKALFGLLTVWLGGEVIRFLGYELILAIGVALPIALILAESFGSGGKARAIYDFLGDLAMMLEAFYRFWDQITGPVANIRNPVVRAVVLLADRIAHLFAQLLGFVSIVMVKIVPLIPSLWDQWRAIKALGTETLQIASDAVDGILEAIFAPFGKGSIKAVVMGLFSALMALPEKVGESLTFLVSAMRFELEMVQEVVKSRVTVYLNGLADRIVLAFKSTDLGLLVGRIRELIALKPDIVAAFQSIGSGTTSAGSAGGGPSLGAQIEDTLRSFKVALGLAALDEAAELLPGERAGKKVGAHLGGKLADLVGAVRKVTIPNLPSIKVPEFPELPLLPDAASLRLLIGEPAALDLGAKAKEMLKAAQASEAGRTLPPALTRRPKSAFAELLRQNAAPSAPDKQQLALRDAIYLAVGRALPAALRVYAPKLREVFDKIDSKMYEIAPTAGPVAEHPQLDLPDSGLLRPMVQVLAIRAPDGADAPALRAFRDLLTAAIQAQPYRAAASAVGG